jgi:hypothetical protein
VEHNLKYLVAFAYLRPTLKIVTLYKPSFRKNSSMDNFSAAAKFRIVTPRFCKISLSTRSAFTPLLDVPG